MPLMLPPDDSRSLAGAFFDEPGADDEPDEITIPDEPGIEPFRPPWRLMVDTREQAPFRFTGFRTSKAQGNRPIIVDLVTDKYLKTGDYSVAGMEDRVSVERKSKADLFGSLGRERERFEREIQRLNDMDFGAVVIEVDWHSIREIPPAFSQMSADSIEGSILSWSVRYPKVHWFPCLDRRHAEWVCYRLLEFCFRELWGKEMVSQ